MGSGTQAVVAEVERRFPEVGVLRWDRDVARTARAHGEVLDKFLKGESRVLVGTQMVAKGNTNDIGTFTQHRHFLSFILLK